MRTATGRVATAGIRDIVPGLGLPGAAFLAGVVFHQALERRWLRIWLAAAIAVSGGCR